jgi:hypothetical protein
MQSGPVSPTTQFTVTLEIQQWNIVLQGMAEAPFKMVAPLVQAIQEQIQQQAPQGNGNGQDMGMPLTPPN